MPMRIGTIRPTLEGATQWFNGTMEEAERELQGHITLIHFWAVSCHICKDNLPRVAEWRDNYKDQGFRVVAVHMPRYPEDTDIKAVEEAIATYKIVEPCAIDNEHKLRDAFLNDQGFVPAYYLFDKESKMRGFAAGERGLNMIFASLNRLLEAAQKEDSNKE